MTGAVQILHPVNLGVTSEELSRFPEDKLGESTHPVGFKVTDITSQERSQWVRGIEDVLDKKKHILGGECRCSKNEAHCSLHLGALMWSLGCPQGRGSRVELLLCVKWPIGRLPRTQTFACDYSLEMWPLTVLFPWGGTSAGPVNLQGWTSAGSVHRWEVWAQFTALLYASLDLYGFSLSCLFLCSFLSPFLPSSLRPSLTSFLFVFAFGIA